MIENGLFLAFSDRKTYPQNMANYNPKTEHLKHSRRGRKSKNTKSFSFNLKVDETLVPAIEQIALDYGCTWGGKPWLGGLINKIARGELLVIPTPRKRKES